MVRVVCTGECGPVVVKRQDFALYVSSEDPRLNHMVFTCSGCNEVCTRPVSEYAAAFLIQAGIKPVPYSPGREVFEHEKFADMPPIDEDFIIDFMLEVERFNRGERSLLEGST